MNWKGKIEGMDSLRQIVHFLELIRIYGQFIINNGYASRDELVKDAETLELDNFAVIAVQLDNSTFTKNIKDEKRYNL